MNDVVNIFDLDIFCDYWLKTWDCNYYPCSSCQSTPPFINVKLEGIQNCPCNGSFQHDIYHEDGTYWYACYGLSPTGPVNSVYLTGGPIDGNYILPYVGNEGLCKWSKCFDISDKNAIAYYNSGSCCSSTPYPYPTYYDKLKVYITKYYESSQ
jgi:hypothetical protein